ncbi:MAG: MerR family transcriptional regulator [Pseudonocardiaceae bacterium]|nr:MerR family transcriptional regulator [Pseudonocardiaceae bacterium]
MSTTAVSTATGYSAQQVRDLEALGVLPPVPRSANGYRRFSTHHVRDLRTYRDLTIAVGPVLARRAMREIRALPYDEAIALVCSFHTTLNRERDEALAARRALRDIRAEEVTDAEPVTEDAMTITELANALGVRTSALRFWEKAGLLSPERVSTRAGTARRYPLPVIREARIITALRTAGYRIPDVRTAINAIRDLHDVGHSLEALEARIDGIAQRALALLRAGAAIVEIIGRRKLSPAANVLPRNN